MAATIGRLYALGNMIVRIYSRDHRPAHVHVIAPDCEALVRLDTLTLMRGQLPMAHRREIMQWIETNRPLIIADGTAAIPTSRRYRKADMSTLVPRLLSADVEHPMLLVLRFDTAPDVRQVVNLAGWVKRGGTLFAALQKQDVFARAVIGAYGGNVTWDEDEGELAIDSVHLEALAAEQNPFTGADAREWQQALGLSDQDAADVLGLDKIAWRTMRDSSAPLPVSTARLCRAASRDPFIAEAHIAGLRRDSAA